MVYKWYKKSQQETSSKNRTIRQKSHLGDGLVGDSLIP